MADTEVQESGDRKLKSDFLLNLCALPINSFPEKLRSNFGLHCLSTAVTPDTFRTSMRQCFYCVSQWTDKNCRVIVKPSKKPGPAVRRILRKVAAGRRLSVIEKKLAMRVTTDNKLVITCQICTKKTVLNLPKPKAMSAEKAAPEPELVLPKKKKKKKKKKGNFVLSKTVNSFYQPGAEKNDSRDIIVLDVTEEAENSLTTRQSLSGNMTVIENLDAKQKRRKKRKKNIHGSNESSSVTNNKFDDSIVTLDSAQATVASNNITIDFMPLVASTPLVSNTKKKSQKNKSRLQSLQMLLDQQGKPKARTSLKQFLSGL